MDFHGRSIIVTEREYFPLLFDFKAKNPSYDFKLLAPQELVARASFSFAKNPIPALLRQGLDYVNAKKWMHLLPLCDLSALPEAKRHYDALPQDCIATDPLGIYELSSCPLYLLELQEDVELHRLLQRKGLASTDISFDDLGVKEAQNPAEPLSFTIYQNKFEQYFHLFSSLRYRLLHHQITPDAVRFLVHDESDVYFLRTLGDLFGIDIDTSLTTTLLQSPGVSSALERMYQAHSLEITEEANEKQAWSVLRPILDEYGLRDLPFGQAYSSLFEILASSTLSELPAESGILAGNRFLFSPHQEVYVTCFQHGVFYKEHSDDDVLSDGELARLGLNTSYVKTQLERRKKWNFLRFHRLAGLSRVKEHLDEKIYDSPFAEDYDYIKLSPGPIEGEGHLFTNAAADVWSMHTLDRAFYRAPLGQYRSYDSRFKGIPSYELEPPKQWSVTHLESYIRCPYRFYLSSLLPRSDRDYRPRFYGVMVHKILEGVYGGDYDLEQSIEAGKTAYKEEREHKEVEPTGYDEVLMELAATNARRYVPLFRQQLRHAHVVKQWSEYPLNFTLSDAQGTYPFHGSADNILLVQDGLRRYYVINDYKTGSEEFRAYEAFLGASTQLPLYYDALTQMGFPEKNQALFGGMGLKKVSFSKLASAFKKSGTKILTLKQGYESFASKGVYIQELEFWKGADNTGIKSDKKQGEVPSGKGLYLRANENMFDQQGAGHLSMIANTRPYSLPEWVNDARAATLEVIHAIEQGVYPIRPSSNDLRKMPASDNLTCGRCPYKNVCYRDLNRDATDYSSAVKEHFKPKKEERDV